MIHKQVLLAPLIIPLLMTNTTNLHAEDDFMPYQEAFGQYKDDEDDHISKSDVIDILNANQLNKTQFNVRNILSSRVNKTSFASTEANNLPETDNNQNNSTFSTDPDSGTSQYSLDSSASEGLKSSIEKYKTEHGQPITTGTGKDKDPQKYKNGHAWMEAVTEVVERRNKTSKYKVDPEVLLAMITQESGGNAGATGAASGLFQIQTSDPTVASAFINYGKSIGKTWTKEDAKDPYNNIEYGVGLFIKDLEHYDGDYLKAIQAHNFSSSSLDKLIDKFGDDWINHTGEMALHNGYKRRTGSDSYGDEFYIRNVLQYYG